MSQDMLVYAVDDDPLSLEIFSEMLQDSCCIRTFTSAAACADALASEQPALLLLDISMPVMDGYTFCQQIKADTATHDIPVVFISSHDTVEERMRGYEAGAEDFITKPVLPDELKRKISNARRIGADRASIHEQLAMSEQLAELALASMDESGLVLQFMSKLVGWDEEQEIAAGLIELLQRYGLSGAVQTRILDQRYTLSPEGIDLPLEVSILNHVSTMGSIFEFHRRGVYNSARATLMVSNMPLDDPDFCGRIRDNLAIAIAGASARLESVESLQLIRMTIENLQDSLASIRQSHDTLKSEASALIYELDHELVRAFVHLGLTTNQENLIEELIKTYMNRLAINLEQGDEIYETLNELGRRLRAFR